MSTLGGHQPVAAPRRTNVLRRFPLAVPLAGASLVLALASAAHGVSARDDADRVGEDDRSAVSGKAGKGAPPGADAGPPYQFRTELMGDFEHVSIKDQLILTRTDYGYRIWGGQQDNHITVSLTDAGDLLIVDTGTARFKRIAGACDSKKTRVGVSAVCSVPNDISEAKPLLIEIWPRLGDDFADVSTLPATFASTFLGDKGHDTALLGEGPDFFNGYSGRDYVSGGGGNDWIRSGLGGDWVWGGAGDDDIVAVEGNDRIRGGPGDDRIWSGDGEDAVWTGPGADLTICGNGRDRVMGDAFDHISRNCESVGIS